MRILQKYQLLIAFALILALPTANSLLGIWQYDRASENRTFADKVNFNISEPDSITTSIDAYCNDNFSFRSPMLDLYHHVKLNVLGISPHPDKTMAGTNNWYYLGGKEVNMYEGRVNIRDHHLHDIEQEWRRRMQYLDQRNIKYAWLIGPMKHRVYSEYLPAKVKESRDLSRLRKLHQYMDATLPGLTVDPTAALIQAKDSSKVYYQLDNHWSHKGGEVAATMLRSKIEELLPDSTLNDVPDYPWNDVKVQWGIHYNTLGIEDISEMCKYPDKVEKPNAEPYGFEPPEAFPYPDEYEYRYFYPKGMSRVKALFIRDSFGDQMIPFLAPIFHESVWIFDNWQYELHEDIIEKVQPDIVIYITYETHIENFIPEK